MTWEKVLTGVGHGKDTRTGVLLLEVLVLELLAVDALATGTLSSVSQVYDTESSEKAGLCV